MNFNPLKKTNKQRNLVISHFNNLLKECGKYTINKQAGISTKVLSKSWLSHRQVGSFPARHRLLSERSQWKLSMSNHHRSWLAKNLKSTKPYFLAAHSYIWYLQVHATNSTLTPPNSEDSSFCYITTNTWLELLKFQMGISKAMAETQSLALSQNTGRKQSKHEPGFQTFKRSRRSTQIAVDWMIFRQISNGLKILHSSSWKGLQQLCNPQSALMQEAFSYIWHINHPVSTWIQALIENSSLPGCPFSC